MKQKVNGGDTVSIKNENEGIEELLVQIEIDSCDELELEEIDERLEKFDFLMVKENYQDSLTLDHYYDSSIVGVCSEYENVVYYYPRLLSLVYENLRDNFEDQEFIFENEKVLYCVDEIDGMFRELNHTKHIRKGLVPPIYIGA